MSGRVRTRRGGPALPFLLGLLFLAGCRTGSDGTEAVPEAPGSETEMLRAGELLGRPTDQALTLTLTAAVAVTAQVQWGTTSGAYDRETPEVAVPADGRFLAVLDGLRPDTPYFYRVRCRPAGGSGYTARNEGRFHTQRPPGSTFTFTLQADPHLDENSDLDLYRRTLANVLADRPDFHVDLGDTFMCEKHSQPLTAVVQPAPDQATIDARYLYERANFGLVAHSVPLFLVNGNHDGELGWLNDGSGENLAVRAARARLRFFLNPVPDGFYNGDALAEPFVGQRASWYAWQWGDALFVVLDPYWNAKTKGGDDGWALTLGDRQYRWLGETLASSPAAYKFVFIHNLVGGLDGQMRGGIEAAPFFEWGGRDADGTYAFPQKRPGWSLPIHPLLVRHGVTAVFHGHDHIYARQELDGVLYLEVPQPSARNFSSGPDLARQYHYASGTILSGSGHVRVKAGPRAAKLEYVRAWLPAQETDGRQNGQVVDSWTVPAPGGGR
jgi:hypothetical protein